MITDSFGRVHDYLRISVTDRCNLRCQYCTPDDLPKGFFSKCTRMTAEEIDEIASVFVRAGVNKIRITGGEPLVRKDIRDILKRLSNYPIELAITTNGVFVNEFIETFRDAGMRSINVSLDTLDRDKYLAITQRDEFTKVMDNINLLLAGDFHVKVNVVALKGFNDTEILKFIEWTKDSPVHVRFIEFMPFNGNQWNKDKVISHQEILDIISSKYHYIKLINEKNDTAKKYFVPGFQGTFAVISTMSEPFCSGCNRMRLTSDGKLFNCLFGRKETDLLSALREGREIESLIHESIYSKFAMLGGNNENKDWGVVNTDDREKSMISLGG